MTPDRTITLRQPDGTLTFQGRTCDRWPADQPVPTTTTQLDTALRRQRTTTNRDRPPGHAA
jgi:hypothetical protein